MLIILLLICVLILKNIKLFPSDKRRKTCFAKHQTAFSRSVNIVYPVNVLTVKMCLNSVPNVLYNALCMYIEHAYLHLILYV